MSWLQVAVIVVAVAIGSAAAAWSAQQRTSFEQGRYFEMMERAAAMQRLVCEIDTDNGADLDALHAITGKGITIGEAIKLRAVCKPQ